MQILSNAVMDIHDGIAYPSCYENFKLSEAGSSNITETTTSSFYMYDFGVVYLLDDHKRALSSSLQSYLNVSGMMPLIPDGDYQGHRSLVSSATCKSLSDLPESSSLITSMDPQAFSETLIHERVEDGEYDCTSCQASFRSLAQLKVHRRAHQGERPFSCTLCHISFSTKQQLMEHVLTHNTLDKTYSCRTCKLVFARPGLLRKHMETHYASLLRATSGDGDPSFAQNVDDDPDANDEESRVPMSSEIQSPPPPALEARKEPVTVLSSSGGAAAAGLVYEGKPVGMLGSSHDPALPSFGLHTAAPPLPLPPPPQPITVARPIVPAAESPVQETSPGGDEAIACGGKKPFVCKVCGKIFTQSGNLSRHRLVHSQEKPFQCTVCSKRFSQKSHLKTHQNVHSGERAFQCQICEKKFSQLGHLKTHINVHLRTSDSHPPPALPLVAGGTIPAVPTSTPAPVTPALTPPPAAVPATPPAPAPGSGSVPASGPTPGAAAGTSLAALSSAVASTPARPA